MTAALARTVDAPPPIPRSRRRARPATLSPGDRIGNWRVDRELGRGGMGSVYAVTHNGFGKRAALKLCHRQVLGPQFTIATFLREARIVHLVDHPGVPDVFATGSYDGRPYLAMERLSGETLGQRLDRGAAAGGPANAGDDRAGARRSAARAELRPGVGAVEMIEILLELCDVLGAAHAAGVVHRDLKLDNVFLLDPHTSAGRRCKLLDWGVARVVGEADPMHGMIAGTLTYVAPEQIRSDELTPAADIYSLGVLAYQMLLGEPPFASRSDLELIRKHVHHEPPAPSSLWHDIPEPLAATLQAMLAKEPARRPPLADITRVLSSVRDELANPVVQRAWLAALAALAARVRSLFRFR